MSLNTRVEIACSVHNIGHFETWSLIYTSFGVDIPFSLSKLYKSRDRATIRIRNRQQTRGYKIRRKKRITTNSIRSDSAKKQIWKLGLPTNRGLHSRTRNVVSKCWISSVIQPGLQRTRWFARTTTLYSAKWRDIRPWRRRSAEWKVSPRMRSRKRKRW